MATPKIKSSFFNAFDDEEEVENKKEVDTKEETEEEETEEVEESDSEQENEEVSEEESDEEFFTSIINDQAEKGRLFYDPEKEYEGTGEEIFDEVIEDTISKKYQEEYLDKIPEEYHSIFEHLRQGKSLTEWVDAVKPVDYSKIDIEEEDSQKSLIEEHLKLTGLDEEDIKDAVEEYEAAGTLEKNAKKALKYLQKNEDGKAKKYEQELEARKEEAERIQEQEFEKFKSEVLATEELGKQKLDKKSRQQLLDHITKPVNKKGESQYVINQKSRDRALQLAYLDMIGFDFSKIEKQAENKANKGLRARLNSSTDLNATRRGDTGRVNTNSNKLPSGPWSSMLED